MTTKPEEGIDLISFDESWMLSSSISGWESQIAKRFAETQGIARLLVSLHCCADSTYSLPLHSLWPHVELCWLPIHRTANVLYIEGLSTTYKIDQFTIWEGENVLHQMFGTPCHPVFASRSGDC